MPRTMTGMNINAWPGPAERRQPPPYSRDAERGVLGAILADVRALDRAHQAGLSQADFYFRAGRVLFFLMEEMAAAGAPIDRVTLAAEVESMMEIKNAGGARYLKELDESVARQENVGGYAGIVRDHARRRTLADELGALRELSLDPAADLDSLCRSVELLANHWKRILAAPPKLAVTTGAEEAASAPAEPAWICKPFAATGAITELSGKVKQAGKTTFLTHLAAAALAGEEFLGQRAVKTPVVYLTEQSPATFRLAMRRAGLAGREDFAVVYWNRTAEMPWEQLAPMALEEAKRRGARLLVVDTLAQFAGISGDSENHSGDALRAMLPLQQAAAEGLAVLVVRQERKTGGAVGDSGRGSSAFAGAVDIVISLRQLDGNAAKNLRLLQAVSRFDEAPDDWVIEWWPETGYRLRGTTADLSRERARQALLDAAPASEAEAVTVEELCAASGISQRKFYRLAEELLETGHLARRGSGLSRDRYQYWAPECSAVPSI